MDDATLTVWNGARFVAYNSWLATAPIQCDEHPPNPHTPPTPLHRGRAAVPGSGW